MVTKADYSVHDAIEKLLGAGVKPVIEATEVRIFFYGITSALNSI
jgi:hypothetical protein